MQTNLFTGIHVFQVNYEPTTTIIYFLVEPKGREVKVTQQHAFFGDSVRSTLLQ